jgi:hypothetical protein
MTISRPRNIEFLNDKKHINLVYQAADICDVDIVHAERSALRYDLMHTLAAKLPYGRIVELGAGRGLDAVPLVVGAGDRAGMHVHLVDWYQDCTGVNGDPYLRTDRRNYYERVVEEVIPDYREPILYISSFAKFAEGWQYPIGMLVWDGNVMKPDNDLSALEPYVFPGGWIVLVDTINNDWSLNARAELYEQSGFYEIYQESITAKNRIYVVRKKVRK